MKDFLYKYKVVILVSLFLIVYACYREYCKYNVDENGVVSIGYVNFYSSGAPESGPYLKYFYCIRNKKYKNMVTTGGDIKPNQEGNYYRIKYLKDNPSESVLYLNKQITDSVAIAKFKADMLRSKELEIQAIRDKQLKK